MPLPTPHKNESHDAFMSRCMANPTMMSDFPDQPQRLAVCFKQSDMREGDLATERRYIPAGDLRVVTGEGMRQKLVGHAIVFNTLSEPLMFFREQIAPEAVDRTLNEQIDMRALIDHEPAKLMGRLTAGTLRVKKDAHGLLVEIDPPDTTYSRDALESVRRGDLTGMSFAFRTMPGGDQWDESTDPPTRTVLDMRISEVSIVTFPAYPATDVDVAQRSLDAYRQQHGYRPSLAMRRRMLDVL
jgi:Escherichia/Staphylococcus phage prohead protease